MDTFISLLELQEKVNSKVVGQEKAVKKITTAIYKHVLRKYAQMLDIEIETNSNLLLAGSSGSGKTYIVREAAKASQLPYIELNAKSISQEGWHGKSFIDQLKNNLDPTNPLWPGTIIFIDEFDKLCMPNYSSGGDDVNQHLQHSLLKYIEGMPIYLFGVDHDTSQFLFVFGGAFSTLTNKKEPKANIGFNKHAHKEEEDTHFYQELIKFGMIPELAGRIRSVSVLNKFDKKMYKQVYNNEHFILNKWLELFKHFKLPSAIPNKVVNTAIKDAIKKDLGCRGFIQSLEDYIDDIINKNAHKI